MTAEKIAELTGHSNPIFTLELSQKPGILFTGGNDKGIVEWSLKDNTFIKVMFPVKASVYAIHGPVGYPLLFTGLRSGQVLVFDFIQQQITKSLNHHLKPIFDIKTVNHKKELLIASEDGTVSVWSLDDLAIIHSIKVSADTIRCIAISPDEKQVAFGCRDNTIQIYDLEDYTLIKSLHGHTMSVFSLAYSPDGTYLISGGRDAQLKIWDTAGYQLIKNIPAHLFAVNHILFHPTQPYFATASMDKSIKIWSSEDFKLYKIISREKGYASHPLSINKLAWTGNHLLSVSDDKNIMIWDIKF
ncbi:WD domain-containing protein, G-beta repeat-containing protein [Mucilaginibacter pineti]|uniref:WD domain-containing protein, G-beta repeat-containing protein n=1 Tax=Mucilaginibacter pineti TaxID=1391627 RepID=A0A1G6UV07_9SPHI|nr:WD40 repeat domain-containing protein [Mucilaginibacter pineti]SDD45168.1 WD domain-containing protein, G-beta repeat-containing protein [Mucilaginibacter pineti]